MRAYRRGAWAGWIAIGLVACGSPGGGEGGRAGAGAGAGAGADAAAVGERGAPASSVAAGGVAAGTATGAVRPAPLPFLGPGERRVAVIVVPGDASVEVDGRPAWRRDGVIELLGKAGEERRVRVFKGAKSTEEKTVRIEEAGASPGLIDLNAPPPPGARGKAESGAKTRPVVVFGFEE